MIKPTRYLRLTAHHLESQSWQSTRGLGPISSRREEVIAEETQARKDVQTSSRQMELGLFRFAHHLREYIRPPERRELVGLCPKGCRLSLCLKCHRLWLLLLLHSVLVTQRAMRCFPWQRSDGFELDRSQSLAPKEHREMEACRQWQLDITFFPFTVHISLPRPVIGIAQRKYQARRINRHRGKRVTFE